MWASLTTGWKLMKMKPFTAVALYMCVYLVWRNNLWVVCNSKPLMFVYGPGSCSVTPYTVIAHFVLNSLIPHWHTPLKSESCSCSKLYRSPWVRDINLVTMIAVVKNLWYRAMWCKKPTSSDIITTGKCSCDNTFFLICPDVCLHICLSVWLCCLCSNFWNPGPRNYICDTHVHHQNV